LETCHLPCRRSCCECLKKVKSNVSAATNPFPSMYAELSPTTETLASSHRKANFARTCFTECSCSLSFFRLCGYARTTFLDWLSVSLHKCVCRMVGSPCRSQRKQPRRYRPTPGPGMYVNCVMLWRG